MHYLRTLLMTWKTGFCLIKPLKGRSVQACPFRKFSSGRDSRREAESSHPLTTGDCTRAAPASIQTVRTAPEDHGTIQTQTSTTPHDQSGTQGTRHSGTGAGHHADHQAADEDQTAVRTLR